MASNSTTSLGIELRDVDDFHRANPSASHVGDLSARGETRERPFAALSGRYGRPLRIAILSDFTRIPYANGAVFQTRFLYQELRRCGHHVTVIGPEDPDARPEELAPSTVGLPSVPVRAYPGLRLPMPLAPWIFDANRWNFDVCFAQTTSLLLEFGTWLRSMKGVPLLCVNTTHLPAAYEVLLPEVLSRSELVQSALLALRRPFDNLFSRIYGQSDGLVVLSEGLAEYWRERGVTVPIHVIPRVVQPEIFDRPLGPDPYAPLLGADLSQRGVRLLCAGRHTREKSQDRVIRIFAERVLPAEPDATLTLVGDGPDTESYRALSRALGAGRRVFFTGEVPWTRMTDFYRYADVFVHASLSETYGNVLGEALWCGTPAVAFSDGMGVSSQIVDGRNGLLFAPGRGQRGEVAADAAFSQGVVELLRDPQMRARMGTAAAKIARDRASPEAVEQRLADAFRLAQDHVAMCSLRPVEHRPRLLQWMTNLRCARPWTAYNGLIYLGGHLRPWQRARQATLHPSFGDLP